MQTSKEQLAEQLNGIEYPTRFSPDVLEMAKGNRLVIVSGDSDDLMSFNGAINDEVSAYEGGTVHLTNTGLLKSECEDWYCPHENRRRAAAAKIEALCYAEAGYTWTFKTDIPHATFEVVEDGGPFCRALVFSLDDIPSQ